MPPPALARASRGRATSCTVPQAWHSPHRPAHLADCQPHSVQRKPYVPPDDLAMARTLAATTDNLSKLEPNQRRESGVSGAAKVPGPPVALSTSSVYPERTPDAFELAARL